ncbi:MAG: hypothetical protein ABSE49_15555 [Polyangiaceae bacterium]
MRRALIASTVGVLATTASASRTARADDPVLSACIAANESSIQRRSEHKLIDARALSLKCAATECPALMRTACQKRVDQIDAAMPSVVFDVKDPSGAAVAFQATMDGQPVPDTSPGAPVSADPGDHRFVFAVTGRTPVERTVTFREGENGRHEPVLVPALPPAVPATIPAPPAVVHPDTAGWSTQKTLAFVAGGVGVVGIGAGTVFGLMARSRWSSSQSECPSSANCPQHAQAVTDHDSASSSATISTIAFVAGGALLAAGGVLWLTTPHTDDAKPAMTSTIGLLPAAGPGGAGLFVTGGF